MLSLLLTASVVAHGPQEHLMRVGVAIPDIEVTIKTFSHSIGILFLSELIIIIYYYIEIDLIKRKTPQIEK